MILIWLIPVVLVLLIASRFSQWRRGRHLRQLGLYPSPGNASLMDVERLVKAGYRVDAVRCYREVYPHVGLAEAVTAVDKMGCKIG